LYDARLTNEKARWLLSVNRNSTIDPTSGERFKGEENCLSTNSISLARNEKINGKEENKDKHSYSEHEKKEERKQEFSQKFFLRDSNEFLELPHFSTKFYITESSSFGLGACNLLPIVLRKRGLAKLFGVGGVSGKPFKNAFDHLGPVLNWNEDIVPNFPLDSNISPLPSSAIQCLPLFESFVSDLEIPQLFQSFRTDGHIDWKHFSPIKNPFPGFVFQLFDYVFNHLDVKPRSLKPLPSFEPVGDCFEHPIHKEHEEQKETQEHDKKPHQEKPEHN